MRAKKYFQQFFIVMVFVFLTAKVIAQVQVTEASFSLTPLSQKSTSTFSLPSIGEVHRFIGYTTFVGVAATVVAGILAPNPYHGPLAYTTAALAVTNTTLGIVRSGGFSGLSFPHGAFAFAGTVGLVSNLFLTEKGSIPHKVTGALSAASFTVAAVLVIQ